jgi:hypothetical protein
MSSCHPSRRSDFPLARQSLCRRASGTYRSSSLRCDTDSRSASNGLRTSCSGAWVSSAWACFSDFCEAPPSPLNISNDGLSAGVHSDVLDPNRLLAFASVRLACGIARHGLIGCGSRRPRPLSGRSKIYAGNAGRASRSPWRSGFHRPPSAVFYVGWD